MRGQDPLDAGYERRQARRRQADAHLTVGANDSGPLRRTVAPGPPIPMTILCWSVADSERGGPVPSWCDHRHEHRACPRRTASCLFVCRVGARLPQGGEPQAVTGRGPGGSRDEHAKGRAAPACIRIDQRGPTGWCMCATPLMRPSCCASGPPTSLSKALLEPSPVDANALRNAGAAVNGCWSAPHRTPPRGVARCWLSAAADAAM